MKKQNPFFESNWGSFLPKLIAASILFHGLILLFLFFFNSIRWNKEVEVIPVFELVQVASPVPPPPRIRSAPPPPPVPEIPEPETPEPEPLPPKPEVKPELPPEPKPKEIPPKEPEPQTPPPEEPPPTREEPPADIAETNEEDDFQLDDMDLPTFNEVSSLAPAGAVDMDPVLQAYLERLKQVIMQNFNPPNGMELPKSTKTTVQFTVDRSGTLSAVTLRKSSGNKTWDHLSVRAVQIAKVPGLPSSYANEALTLNFNFTPN